MINIIARSLLLTVMVALIVGGLLNYLFDYALLKTAVSALVVQFVFFYLYNSVVQLVMSSKFEREQTIQAEYFSKQGVDVSCAHCNNINFIPISMADVNEFVCDVCGKQNSVYVDITVAQKTDIVDTQSVKVNSNDKEKANAEQKLRKQ